MTIKINVPKRPDPTMKLVYVESGIEVKVGDKVTDFRGDKAIVTGWREPQTSNSTGRIYVDFDKVCSEFYPSVFNCKFVPIKPE